MSLHAGYVRHLAGLLQAGGDLCRHRCAICEAVTAMPLAEQLHLVMRAARRLEREAAR